MAQREKRTADPIDDSDTPTAKTMACRSRSSIVSERRQELLSERAADADLAHAKGSRDTDRSRGKGNRQQFVDDKSGRKPIQSYSLRFALQVMEAQARQSRQSVSQQLAESGNLEESQQVLVCATHHEKEIMERVRKRLRESLIPSVYLKTEDPCVVNLQQLNLQRSREIQVTQQTIDKLEKETKALKKESRKAKAEQRKLLEAEAQHKEAQGKAKDNNIHPLLKPYFGVTGASLANAETPRPLTVGEMNYRRAPKGTMSALLKKMSR